MDGRDPGREGFRKVSFLFWPRPRPNWITQFAEFYKDSAKVAVAFFFTSPAPLFGIVCLVLMYQSGGDFRHRRNPPQDVWLQDTPHWTERKRRRSARSIN